MDELEKKKNKKLQESVLTFGNFDGIHLGHQKIINKLQYYSKKYKIPSVLISFNPHPAILLKNRSKFLLNSLGFKLKKLNNSNIDHVVIIPFSKKFSKISANKFLEEIIIKYFNPSIIVTGKDNTFGYNRLGNYKFLNDYFKNLNCKIKLQENLISKDSSKISSTNIRNLILQDNVQHANKLLGYEFNIDCKVIKGNQIGRKLTFPTINLLPNDKHHLIPSSGVYFVSVEINGDSYLGMCNIGINPTVNKRKVESIEAHLFECNQDFYEKDCVISFKRYIRKEFKFESKEHLIAQLNRDKNMCIQMS